MLALAGKQAKYREKIKKKPEQLSKVHNRNCIINFYVSMRTINCNI